MDISMNAFWSNTLLSDVTLNKFDKYCKEQIPNFTKKTAHDAFGIKLQELRSLDLDAEQVLIVDDLEKQLKTCMKDEENCAIWQNKRQIDEVDNENESELPSKIQDTGTSTDDVSNVSAYLKSGGSYDCSLKLTDQKWKEDDLDVSDMLMEFRRESLEKGQLKQKVKDLEVLTFNNIFFFSNMRKRSVTKFFPLNVHKTINPKLNYDEHKQRLPDIVKTWLSNIADIAANGKIEPVRDYCQSLLNSKEVKQDKKLKFVAVTLFNLAPKFKTWERKGVVEDTFVKNQFSDALDVILGQDDDHEEIEYEWCNKKVSSSYLKPDYTIKVEGTDEEHTELFIIEVKAPMRNRSSYDFIKTAFTMKDMLDKLIRKGVENPIVTGLLINGYNCYLYNMSLHYEAIYAMLELEKFMLPESYIDFPRLKYLFEAIYEAKDFIIETANNLDQSVPPETESPLTRPSFSPTKA